MIDLLGHDPDQAAALTGDMNMGAHFSEDGKARLILRYTWDHTLPRAAWFMNNPSVAGKLGPGERVSYDPTARRVIHFSKMLGCGTAYLVNWCPIVATEPADLWRMLKADGFPASLELSNHLAIAQTAAAADFLVMACGSEGLKRHPDLFRAAAARFIGDDEVLTLGLAPSGAPLHPLARGKHAVLNKTRPVPFNARDWMLSDAV